MITYSDIAKQAANQEQVKQFGFAAQLWEKAEPLANNKENRRWALARKGFCHSRFSYNQT